MLTSTKRSVSEASKKGHSFDEAPGHGMENLGGKLWMILPNGSTKDDKQKMDQQKMIKDDTWKTRVTIQDQNIWINMGGATK